MPNTSETSDKSFFDMISDFIEEFYYPLAMLIFEHAH